MRVNRKAKEEAVARAWELVHRPVPLRDVLRFLSTQLLAKQKLGPKEQRNLLHYEGWIDRDVKASALTVEGAITKHVRHLDRLAAKGQRRTRPKQAA